MTDAPARASLPPLPPRIARLSVDRRGFPVPRFVAWVGGEPDFRVADASYLGLATRRRLCWLCGDPLGVHLVFPIGPMCAVSRTTSEPPSHRECAEFAVRACPFLTNPEARRRERGIPEGHAPAAGVPIARNPGVTCLWASRSFLPFQAPGGVLFRIGEPEAVAWYCRGREATRAEVEASIAGGMPLLRATAEAQGPAAVRELERMAGEALALLPAA